MNSLKELLETLKNIINNKLVTLLSKDNDQMIVTLNLAITHFENLVRNYQQAQKKSCYANTKQKNVEKKILPILLPNISALELRISMLEENDKNNLIFDEIHATLYEIKCDLHTAHKLLSAFIKYDLQHEIMMMHMGNNNFSYKYQITAAFFFKYIDAYEDKNSESPLIRRTKYNI